MGKKRRFFGGKILEYFENTPYITTFTLKLLLFEIIIPTTRHFDIKFYLISLNALIPTHKVAKNGIFEIPIPFSYSRKYTNNNKQLVIANVLIAKISRIPGQLVINCLCTRFWGNTRFLKIWSFLQKI